MTCFDDWSDLRVGDDVEDGVVQIGTVTLTQFVSASLTAGWIVVDAVDGNRLTVRWGKPWASQVQFDLVIGPSTRWNTATRRPEVLCPGQGPVHMVGGQQEAGVVAAWTLSPGDPRPDCSTSS